MLKHLASINQTSQECVLLSDSYKTFSKFLTFLLSERIQRRYGDLNGELLLVDLTRGTGGLGISLAGNKDRNTMSVFVAGIQPESSAALDGRIVVGDELLEVLQLSTWFNQYALLYDGCMLWQFNSFHSVEPVKWNELNTKHNYHKLEIHQQILEYLID